MVTNVGREMCFKLPLNASSTFGHMLRNLDQEVHRGSISSYGLNMTTLEEVFLKVTRGEEPVCTNSLRNYSHEKLQEPNCCQNSARNHDHEKVGDQRGCSVSPVCKRSLYWTHMNALLRKRRINFQRDKKAWCCTTILPSLFVLLGFLALKYASPQKDLEPLLLDLEAYNVDLSDAPSHGPRNPIPFNSPGSHFKCQPGWCAYQYPIVEVKETQELYFFCGGQSYLFSSPNCSIDMSDDILSRFNAAGAAPTGKRVSNLNEVNAANP
jgi:hypothetical protein